LWEKANYASYLDSLFSHLGLRIYQDGKGHFMDKIRPTYFGLIAPLSFHQEVKIGGSELLGQSDED